jgi:hypothetical protein
MRVLDPRDFGRATGSSTRVNNRIQDGDPLVGNNIILNNGHKTASHSACKMTVFHLSWMKSFFHSISHPSTRKTTQFDQ